MVEKTETTEKPAESLPAPEPEPEEEQEAPELEELSEEQYQKWLETGEFPKPPKSEASAPSTSEKLAESEPAQEEKQPESEEQPQQKKGQDAETRKAQLAAEIQDLLNQRRKLREEISQAAPPKQQPESHPEAKAPERPKRPKSDDFEDWADYEKALEEYEEKLTDWKISQRIEAEKKAYQEQLQQQAINQRNAAVRKNWETRLAESKKRHADFDEVVRSVDLPLNPIMDGYLLESELGPELVYELCNKVSEAQRIAQLPGFQCVSELSKLEASISEALKTPPPKKITEAKPPPTELSGTNRAADDEADAALEAGDFRRYMEIMNKRDAARISR